MVHLNHKRLWTISSHEISISSTMRTYNDDQKQFPQSYSPKINHGTREIRKYENAAPFEKPSIKISMFCILNATDQITVRNRIRSRNLEGTNSRTIAPPNLVQKVGCTAVQQRVRTSGGGADLYRLDLWIKT